MPGGAALTGPGNAVSLGFVGRISVYAPSGKKCPVALRLPGMGMQFH